MAVKVKSLRSIRTALFLAAACVNCAPGLRAQDPSLPQETPSPASAPATPARKKPVANSDTHRFWDQTNLWLFAGVAGSRGLDYSSTLNMRRRGNHEILLTNDVVDNHAGFAAIEAAGTATSIGVSYLFHRYGHHKLERWTSIVHIGLTTAGAIRNYNLPTKHPAP
jgi:hypothetical protein